MSESRIQALVIRPDQAYEVRKLDDKPSAYRKLVGDTDGTFEVANITIWCSNEPGPFNSMASFLWWKLEPAIAELERLDGTVVITGLPDEAGYPTPLLTTSWRRTATWKPANCHGAFLPTRAANQATLGSNGSATYAGPRHAHVRCVAGLRQEA